MDSRYEVLSRLVLKWRAEGGEANIAHLKIKFGGLPHETC